MVLLSSCAIWFSNMLSYIKGRMKVNGTLKQDTEINIWDEERGKWVVKKAPQ